MLEPTGRSVPSGNRGMRSLIGGVLAFVILLGAGTTGYVIVEGWSWLDSFYMVIITLSTVGFREVHPLSPAGQVLTSGLVLFGVAVFAYVAAAGFRLTLEGELLRVVGRRRMEKEIGQLTDHVIVCGYGRVGRETARNLQAEETPLVVVEKDPDGAGDLIRGEFLYVRGDAVEEDVLVAAGLARARAILLTLANEADNVYATLIARELAPDAQIVARSISTAGARRLEAAGADRVVSPEQIGARAMSHSVLRPNAVAFTEVVTSREDLSLAMDEQLIGPESELVGNSVESCHLRSRYGLIVVGLVTPEGNTLFNPDPGHAIEAGSTLIALGRRSDLMRFAEDLA